MHLSQTLKEKWVLYEQIYDKVILQHDNAQPHIATPIKTEVVVSQEGNQHNFTFQY